MPDFLLNLKNWYRVDRIEPSETYRFLVRVMGGLLLGIAVICAVVSLLERLLL